MRVQCDQIFGVAAGAQEALHVRGLSVRPSQCSASF